jgi:cellulose synthase/poly-beta-1,6-N-acetylglucosamine synthase-like glycosyltransferase
VTLPKRNAAPGFPWTWLEIVDWSFLLGTCSAFAGIGRPQGLIGNNFSIRRTTYDEIGTFRKHKYHVADDMTLLSAVRKTKKWKIVSPADNGLCIRTLPMQSVREQVSQRRRWIKGGSKMEWHGLLSLSYGMLIHLAWPLVFIFCGFAGLLPYLLITAGSAFIALPMLVRFRETKTALFLPIYHVYTCAYGWLLFLYLLSGKKVMWKSRPA